MCSSDLMQPLLENVFKHTVERRRGVTKIDISAKQDGDSLVLVVRDDAGMLAANGATGGAGIGVSNLRERLRALYGEQAALRLVQLEPAGVRAEMRLPCVS